MSKEQETLFKRLAELEAAPPSTTEQRDRGFWTKVREAFSA